MKNGNKYQKGLEQFANTTGTTEKLDNVLAILSRITSICGEATNQRRPLLRIGKTLLMSNEFRIIAPCCPDYSHKNGLYTFEALNSGISLLAQTQIDFLHNLQDLGIAVKALFLYADQEAEDEKLLKMTRTEQTEFLERVDQSVQATKEFVSHYGWRVELMSKFVTDFRTQEKRFANQINCDANVSRRIQSETLSRMEMYLRIQNPMPWDEAVSRTVRTAAQYMVLGNFAREHNYLISNHTTTNLAWYAETDAGVLHNPVAIY